MCSYKIRLFDFWCIAISYKGLLVKISQYLNNKKNAELEIGRTFDAFTLVWISQTHEMVGTVSFPYILKNKNSWL